MESSTPPISATRETAPTLEEPTCVAADDGGVGDVEVHEPPEQPGDAARDVSPTPSPVGEQDEKRQGSAAAKPKKKRDAKARPRVNEAPPDNSKLTSELQQRIAVLAAENESLKAATAKQEQLLQVGKTHAATLEKGLANMQTKIAYETASLRAKFEQEGAVQQKRVQELEARVGSLSGILENVRRESETELRLQSEHYVQMMRHLESRLSQVVAENAALKTETVGLREKAQLADKLVRDVGLRDTLIDELIADVNNKSRTRADTVDKKVVVNLLSHIVMASDPLRARVIGILGEVLDVDRHAALHEQMPEAGG